MKVKRSLPLRSRVLFVFLAVVLLIIGTYYFMNNVFWNKYYMQKNRRLMKEAYTEFSALLSDPEMTEEMLLSAAAERHSSENISFALQGNSDWDFMVVTRQMVSSYEREFLLERLQDDMLSSVSEGVTVLEEGENYTLQYVEVPDTGARFLECYGYMADAEGTEKKFILSMPLEMLYEASGFSNVFFLYLSLLLLVVGGGVVFFAVYRVTRPILQLSELSRRMSRLDFSARYEGNVSDEIGELGNNMNEMASQLERTILQLQMANTELKKDLEEKEHADEMRKDFISNVSHELKTPIALIQGYAEGLKEFGTEDPESMNYYCDVITDEADRMNRLVKKLTTLNQIEFGGDELQMAPFDITEVIRNIVNGSGKLVREHDAKVEIFCPEECMVLGDEFKIEEVINNYYSNAFNHLKAPGNITFTLTDLGLKARISVKNSGDPIPEEELSRIWIKFYKVDKARTRAYGGSGIGLSIVKAIMKAHHEECGVYNEEDGVVFWFELQKILPEENGASGAEYAGEDAENGEDVMNGEILREV